MLHHPLDRSVIVAAHPDDEILWFSSIIDKVDAIILCYLDVGSHPDWSSGRRESLAAYPFRNISCLGITESEVFNAENWHPPVVSEYGLQITKKHKTGSIERYRTNFSLLQDLLSEKLRHYTNVYTHNPWGEYGNEEHIQVYRAVRALLDHLPFNLWHSNYFSNKSATLMNICLDRSSLANYRMPTNKTTALRLMDLYKRHHCWTWYDDYRWPESECFILDGVVQQNRKMFGKTLDLNYINVWTPPRVEYRPWRTVKTALRSIIKSR